MTIKRMKHQYVGRFRNHIVVNPSRAECIALMVELLRNERRVSK